MRYRSRSPRSLDECKYLLREKTRLIDTILQDPVCENSYFEYRKRNMQLVEEVAELKRELNSRVDMCIDYNRMRNAYETHLPILENMGLKYLLKSGEYNNYTGILAHTLNKIEMKTTKIDRLQKAVYDKSKEIERLKKENEEKNSRLVCSVCLTGMKEFAFVKCKHFCLCKSCMIDHPKENDGTVKCPICRQNSYGYDKIYQ